MVTPNFVVEFLVIILIVQLFLPVYAEITYDGSLGLAGALLGPNYRIEASRGTLIGGNLFHSFSKFNIDIGESATFTGADHIANRR